jgi:hypothetical protein
MPYRVIGNLRGAGMGKGSHAAIPRRQTLHRTVATVSGSGLVTGVYSESTICTGRAMTRALGFILAVILTGSDLGCDFQLVRPRQAESTAPPLGSTPTAWKGCTASCH